MVTDNIRFHGILADDLHFVINEVKSFLLPAIERDKEFAFGDIIANILNKESQLWCLYQDNEMIGCLVSMIRVFPKKKTCLIHLLGGKGVLRYQDYCMPILEAWAKEKGCVEVSFEGRKGFERLVKRRDYKQTNIILTKQI